jgi:DNA mismatch repair protein MutL
VLFVNGRTIVDQSLTYAVVQAYHTLLPSGRYPVAALMITLPPEEVDVNVHPTKAEVRFRVPDAVFSAVQRAVRRAVVDQAPVPGMGPEADSEPGWGAHRDDVRTDHDYIPPRERYSGEQQLRMELETPDPGRYRQQQQTDLNRFAEPVRPAQVEIPAGPGRPLRPRTLPILRVVGQVGATYIVAEGPAGMYLIDQHAAHERILYEQFMAQQAAQEPVAQHTLPVTTLELNPAAAALVEEQIETLAGLGFDLERFGTNTFRIRSIPALLADENPEGVIRAIVEDLESGLAPGEATLEEKLIRRVCKAAAVKAGQTLSYEEMQGLIQQLERCESPRTCPHGRPTMLHLSGDDLARQFGRM